MVMVQSLKLNKVLVGGLVFYTIGETLFDKEGNLNDRADLQSIREYIAHSEKLETVF